MKGKKTALPCLKHPAVSEAYEMSDIQRTLQDQMAASQERLDHLPFVLSNSHKMVVWTDIKEFLLLWCASPTCSVVLNALRHQLNYPASHTNMHPCTPLEQLLFRKQFVDVAVGTLLVDLDALRHPPCIMALHDLVRTKHKVSRDPAVIFCNRLVAALTDQYASSGFLIPQDTLRDTKLLPAICRNEVMPCESSLPPDSCDSETDVCNMYVSLSCLLDMFPGCGSYLEEVSQAYWPAGGATEGHRSTVTHCSPEEALQLSRFLTCYRGHGGPWRCLTSTSLMMLWTEFWSATLYHPSLQHVYSVNDVSLVIVNSQATRGAAVDWIKQEPDSYVGNMPTDCQVPSSPNHVTRSPSHRKHTTRGPVTRSQDTSGMESSVQHVCHLPYSVTYGMVLQENDGNCPEVLFCGARCHEHQCENVQKCQHDIENTNEADKQTYKELQCTNKLWNHDYTHQIQKGTKDDIEVKNTKKEVQETSKEIKQNIREMKTVNKKLHHNKKALNVHDACKEIKQSTSERQCIDNNIKNDVQDNCPITQQRNLRLNTRNAIKNTNHFGDLTKEEDQTVTRKKDSANCERKLTEHDRTSKRIRARPNKMPKQNASDDSLFESRLIIDETMSDNEAATRKTRQRNKILKSDMSDTRKKAAVSKCSTRKDINNSADIDMTVCSSSKGTRSADSLDSVPITEVTPSEPSQKDATKVLQNIVIPCHITMDGGTENAHKAPEEKNTAETETVPVRKVKPKSAVSFSSSSSKSPTQRIGSSSQNRQRRVPAERQTLRVRSAVFEYNLPPKLKAEIPSPTKLMEKTLHKKSPKGKFIKSVQPETGQSLELPSPTITVFKNVTPRQFELIPPSKTVIGLESPGEQSPYRSTRTSSILREGCTNPLTQSPQSQSTLTSVNNPIITGCSLQVGQQRIPLVRPKSAVKPTMKRDIDTVPLKQPHPELTDGSFLYLVPENWSQRENIDQNAQANTVSNGRPLDITDFQSKRITMWKDMAVSRSGGSPPRRLIKSADMANRKAAMTYYRPMSSIYSSPYKGLHKDSPCFKSALGAIMSRCKDDLLPNQSEKQEHETSSQILVPDCSNTVDRAIDDAIFDVNYGSSSSTTPDIYDEFARKRRPRNLKVEATQIKAKPKPLTKIVSPQLQTVKKPVQQQPQIQPSKSQHNHRTVGYTFSPAVSILNQHKYWNAASSTDVPSQQKYQYINSSVQNNLPFDSQTQQCLNMHLADANRPSQEVSCRMCQEQEKLSSGQLDFNQSTFDKQQNTMDDTYRQSVHMTNSHQHVIESPLFPVRQTYSDITLDQFRTPYVPEAHTAEDMHQTNVQNRKTTDTMFLLDKGSTFATETVENDQTNSFSCKFMRENILNTSSQAHVKDSPLCEEGLSRIDTELYYSVPGDGTVHLVTGDTVIPRNAQFYTKAHTTPKSDPHHRSDSKQTHHSSQIQQERITTPDHPNNLTCFDFDPKSKINTEKSAATTQSSITSEMLIEETKKKLSIDSNETCKSETGENSKQKIAENAKHSKTLLPSKPSQQKGNIPKKSFREVVEEQREAKKKAETELLKKKFWISAHAIGTKNKKTALPNCNTGAKGFNRIKSAGSASGGNKPVTGQKSHVSLKSLSSTGDVKIQKEKSQLSRSTSCKSYRSQAGANRINKVRDTVTGIGTRKNLTGKGKPGMSTIDEPTSHRKLKYSTLKIMSALRKLSLDESDAVDKHLKQNSARQHRLRSRIERQILGQNKTQRKFKKQITNIQRKPITSKIKNTRKKESDGIDHTSTPDDRVVTAVEKHPIEKTEICLQDKTSNAETDKTLKNMEGKESCPGKQSKRKQKKAFITQRSLKEIIVLNEKDEVDKTLKSRHQYAQAQNEQIPVNINTNNVALIDKTVTTNTSPVCECCSSDMVQQKEAAVEVVSSNNNQPNSASHTVLQNEAKHELLEMPVLSPENDDNPNNVTRASTKQLTDAGNDLGTVLSIQEQEDTQGFKVEIRSGSGESKNIPLDDPSYQELMKFYQEHGLTQMFKDAMSYFKNFSKQQIAEPLLADLDLVTVTTEASGFNEAPEHETGQILLGEINLRHDNLDKGPLSKEMFAPQLFSMSRKQIVNQKREVTYIDDQRIYENSIYDTKDSVSIDTVAGGFGSNSIEDMPSHADNIFEALNDELMKINGLIQSMDDNGGDPVIANVMFTDRSKSNDSLVTHEAAAGCETGHETKEDNKQADFVDETDFSQEICSTDAIFENTESIESTRGTASSEAIQRKSLIYAHVGEKIRSSKLREGKLKENKMEDKIKVIRAVQCKNSTKSECNGNNDILKGVEPAVRCAALGLRDSARHSYCEVYLDVDGDVQNTRSEDTLPYVTDSEYGSDSEDDTESNGYTDFYLEVDNDNDTDYVPDVSEEEEDNDAKVTRNESGERTNEHTSNKVLYQRKIALSKLEKIRNSLQKKYDMKLPKRLKIERNMTLPHADTASKSPEEHSNVPSRKCPQHGSSKKRNKDQTSNPKRIPSSTTSYSESPSTSGDEDILNSTWKLIEGDLTLESKESETRHSSNVTVHDNNQENSGEGAEGDTMSDSSFSADCVDIHKKGGNAAVKKERKKKFIKDVDTDDSDHMEEGRKQREEQLAAEAFIRQQQMYYEIIKNSSLATPKLEVYHSVPVASDVTEVLMEIPVQGDRDISRAVAEAEKALEGTGSLSDGDDDEGVIIEDLINSCTYQLVEDEDRINLGGVCYFRDFMLPFVYINGYKFTPLKDALTMFQPRVCGSACRIPRSVLQKHKSLMKTFSTWDQVYKFELIKMKKGPSIMTGDVLLKLDCLISLLPELVQQVVTLHEGTKLKYSQHCLIHLYSNLTGRTHK